MFASPSAGQQRGEFFLGGGGVWAGGGGGGGGGGGAGEGGEARAGTFGSYPISNS